MAGLSYSIDYCRDLLNVIREARLEVPSVPTRYEKGDILDLEFVTVWPEKAGRGTFRIEKFVGGGFAGQVYRCRLVSIEMKDGSAPCLKKDAICAVKIMLPPEQGARSFRDFLFGIGYQSAFGAQVHESACRAGLLWQKLSRLAAGRVFGSEEAVADVYASFYDPHMSAFGEIREWVEGRTWRLEADAEPRKRKPWRTVDPRATHSPEYMAKRKFMARFVEMLHQMGARELARQYEWWTMKSQPNVLKRNGYDADPAGGLCAVDFRAGLVLLPFLPMSPGDVALILRGLRKGAWVQFDRCDMSELRRFSRATLAGHPDVESMIDRLAFYDRQYRRSMPDITGQGFSLLVDPELRRDVRRGMISAWQVQGQCDEASATRLQERTGRFWVACTLGLVPFLGGMLRKFLCVDKYRMHWMRIFCDGPYFQGFLKAGLAQRLLAWHRSGRIGERHARLLLRFPLLFWMQKFTVGFLPASLHRNLMEPAFAWARVRDGLKFAWQFCRNHEFRAAWLADQVRDGYAEGMLDVKERDLILSQIDEPLIGKYLQCLAAHFATLPITQIVSVTVGAVMAAWILLSGGSWEKAVACFAGIVLLFQVIPISPGSICRGLYVVYRMIRDRNVRDYVVAAPLAFLKYIGYLSLPIQMVATYPELARFMASRWATAAVNSVPVFGEKGALFEHMVFDLCFNYPRVLAKRMSRRVRGILNAMCVLGTGLLVFVLTRPGFSWTSRTGFNQLALIVSLFLLPRLLFYPLMKRRKSVQDR